MSGHDEALPRVDFYHLQSEGEHQLKLFCCRLVDKAWQLGNRVCILTDDPQQANSLDDLLWTWRDDGFLPHGIHQPGDDDAPVCITHQLPAGAEADLLVNLQSGIPDSVAQHQHRFSRIAEIIDQNPNTKQAGRIRYSYYDKNNYPLEYHEITSG